MKNKPSKLQRILGLVLLAMCALVVFLAYTGVTQEDKDATSILLLAPLGLFMLLSNEDLIG